LLLVPARWRNERNSNRLEQVFSAGDINLGKRAATDAESSCRCGNAPKVDAYLTELGTRLAQKLPTGGVQYPFESIASTTKPSMLLHCLADMCCDRGAIEAADNEAQLAAVMAHELSHVALRHGTNQADQGDAGGKPDWGFSAPFSGIARAARC